MPSLVMAQITLVNGIEEISFERALRAFGVIYFGSTLSVTLSTEGQMLSFKLTRDISQDGTDVDVFAPDRPIDLDLLGEQYGISFSTCDLTDHLRSQGWETVHR